MATKADVMTAAPELLKRERAERERREAIRTARIKAGLSQEELAKAVYKAKRIRLSQAKLSLYENGSYSAKLSGEELSCIESVLLKALGEERLMPGLSGKLSELSGKLLATKAPQTEERKLRRERAGISQQELAKAAGIYRSKITEWENGNLELATDEMDRVEAALVEAEWRQRRSDPYCLIEALLSAVADSERETKEAENRIAVLEEVNKIRERMCANYEEHIEILRSFALADEEAEKDEKIARLEKEKKLLVDLLNTETDKALADKRATELREKIASANEG